MWLRMGGVFGVYLGVGRPRGGGGWDIVYRGCDLLGGGGVCVWWGMGGGRVRGCGMMG